MTSTTTQVKRRAGRAAAKTRRQAKQVGAAAKRTARRSGREIKGATANPWLTRLTRLGYVLRGALYGVMGGLALTVALGATTRTPDQRGEIVILGGNPLAPVALVVMVVGLAAYSIWGFVRAVYDPLGRGDGPTGIAARLGFAWSGLNYAALVVLAMSFLSGTASRHSDDSMQQTVAAVVRYPEGWLAVMVAGVIGTLAGLAQFGDAVKATFRRDMKRNQMSKPERVSADVLGRFGMFSRGVIFTMLGLFVLQAGIHRDVSEAHGMGVAFATLASQPMGHVLLAVVAMGFIALGLHSLANARWVRLPRQA